MYCESVVYGPLSQPGVEIGTGMPSSPLPGFEQIVAGDDDLLARRVLDEVRLDRCGHRLLPRRIDLIERHAHADAIDLLVRRDHADGDGDVVVPALRCR